MKKVVAMTIHDRTPEVVDAVFTSLRMPGNTPDDVAVCFDRCPKDIFELVKMECWRIGVNLRIGILDDEVEGPRCPSRAWNTIFKLIEEDHVFCISSDTVLAPHSVGMAFHLSQVAPDFLIVGRAEHCGQSYTWTLKWRVGTMEEFKHRTMTWHQSPKPLGFNWLLPMKRVREIGGYDEAFMRGYCYEDSDFVLRLWNAGVDFVFCDDIVGFHLEHKRDHLLDEDGKVSQNEGIFVSRYGHKDYLEHLHFRPLYRRCDVALGFWTHDESEETLHAIAAAQLLYGNEEPWRAIKTKIINMEEE